MSNHIINFFVYINLLISIFVTQSYVLYSSIFNNVVIVFYTLPPLYIRISETYVNINSIKVEFNLMKLIFYKIRSEYY